MAKTQTITKDQQIQNQIQTMRRLEPELQKCLEDDDPDTAGSTTVKLSAADKRSIIKRTLDKASKTLRGCLDISGCFDYSARWQALRNALIADERLDSMRGDKFFKYGLQIVMYITDTMIEAQAAAEEYLQEKESWLICQLLEEHDEGDYKALMKLIEAFEMIAGDLKQAKLWDLKPEDVNDLRIDLTTIARCHRMVLDAHTKWS